MNHHKKENSIVNRAWGRQVAAKAWGQSSRLLMHWMQGLEEPARWWPSAAATRLSYSGSKRGVSFWTSFACNSNALYLYALLCLCAVVRSCFLHVYVLSSPPCREFSGGLKAMLCGFVNNMAEWMTACDAIVTKAGPGTIAEALICGLPLILNGFIPCQVRRKQLAVLAIIYAIEL